MLSLQVTFSMEIERQKVREMKKYGELKEKN